MFARILEGELGQLVLDLVDRDARPKDPDPAGLGIDPDMDVLVARDPSIGGLDAVLDGSDELLTRDLLLGVELEEGTDEVSTHDGLRSVFVMFCRNRRSIRNVGVTHVPRRPFGSANYTPGSLDGSNRRLPPELVACDEHGVGALPEEPEEA